MTEKMAPAKAWLIRSGRRTSADDVPHAMEHVPAPQAGHDAPPVAPDAPALERAVRDRHGASQSQRAIARELKIDHCKVKRIIGQPAEA